MPLTPLLSPGTWGAYKQTRAHKPPGLWRGYSLPASLSGSRREVPNSWCYLRAPPQTKPGKQPMDAEVRERRQMGDCVLEWKEQMSQGCPDDSEGRREGSGHRQIRS